MNEMLSAMYARAQNVHNDTLRDIALRTGNKQTTGYKKNFSWHVSKGVQTKMGRVNVPSYRNESIDFTQGALQKTGNMTHMALSGKGFFIVETPSGKQLLTRNGAFKLNNENQLVTQDNYPVLAGGGPLVVAQAQLPIKVNESGQVIGRLGVIGQIDVKKVEQPERLQEAGGYYMFSPDMPLEDAEVNTYALSQGYLERSNVNVAEEAAQMAVNSRNIQTLKNASAEIYKTRLELISALARVN